VVKKEIAPAALTLQRQPLRNNFALGIEAVMSGARNRLYYKDSKFANVKISIREKIVMRREI